MESLNEKVKQVKKPISYRITSLISLKLIAILRIILKLIGKIELYLENGTLRVLKMTGKKYDWSFHHVK